MVYKVLRDKVTNRQTQYSFHDCSYVFLVEVYNYSNVLTFVIQNSTETGGFIHLKYTEVISNISRLVQCFRIQDLSLHSNKVIRHYNFSSLCTQYWVLSPDSKLYNHGFKSKHKWRSNI